MFCKNCGNKLSAGEKFCSVCGAKVESGTEQPVTNNINTNNSFSKYNETRRIAEDGFRAPSDSSFEKKEERSAIKRSTQSFDWSSVVDESHRKVAPDIKSPWESTGLDESDREATTRALNARKKSVEERVQEDASASAPSRGRTMTFIDILKQEREEKERKANEQVVEATKPRNPLEEADYSQFDDKESSFGYTETVLPVEDREYTQGYTDFKRNVVEGINEKAPAPREPEYRNEDPARAYLEERKRSRENAEPMEEPVPPRSFVPDREEPRSFVPDREEPRSFGPDREEPRSFVPDREEPRSFVPDREEPRSFVSDREEPRSFVPDRAETNEIPSRGVSTEDEYVDFEPRGRSDRRTRSELYSIDDLNAADKARIKDDTTSEIEALQQKLADLLGQKEEEPERVAKREVPKVEDLEDEFDDFSQYDDTLTEDEYVDDSFDAFADDEYDTESEDDYINSVLSASEDEEEDDEAFTPAPKNEYKDADNFIFDDEPANTDNHATEVEEFEGIFDDAPEEDDLFDVDSADNDYVSAKNGYPQESDTTADAAIDESEAKKPEVVIGDSFSDTDEGDLNIDAELAALGFDDEAIRASFEEANSQETPSEDQILFSADDVKEEAPATSAAAASEDEVADDAMSIDELEKDLFGSGLSDDDAEATRKIDKFYTLYKKNEEFQQLLDSEYDKLKNGEDVELEDDQLSSIVENTEIPNEEPEIPAEMASAIDAPELLNTVNQSENAAPSMDLNAGVSEAAKPEAVKTEPMMQEAVKATSNTMPLEMPATATVPQAMPKIDPVDEGQTSKKGGILTVLAIIVAVLLAILLIVILILSFAPNSGIAGQLNQVIDNFSNFFAANDVDSSILL